MIKINDFKYFIIGALISIIGCTTPQRELGRISKENCDRSNVDTATLVFQDTESHPWSEWEKKELSNFLKEYTCADIQKRESKANLELIFKKNDTSPSLSTFETVTGVVSLLTLFLVPSNREMAEHLQLEVRDLRDGRVKTFETELQYSKFSHVFALATIPFRDDEFDFDKKLIFELISKARSENFRL